LGQVAAYIACGVTSRPTNGRDAPQHNILPFGWEGCPPRDLFAKKLFAKRPSGDIPAGGMSGAQSVPPVQRAGGTYFSKFSQLAPLFRILVFLNPFLKKPPASACNTKEWPQAHITHPFLLLDH
jgi:hypothetical protein